MEAVYVDKHYHLVDECKQGSRKAHYELYKLYSKAMYNVAMRVLDNADEAADVLQESFIDAFKRLPDFRQETTFGLWMKQIVVNKSISQLRKRRENVISMDDTDVEDLVDDSDYDQDEIQFQVEQVKRGINMLPEGYKVVLTLYLLEGYDHEEIAHILKISENTSRTQFMRAKRKLLELLKEQRYE